MAGNPGDSLIAASLSSPQAHSDQVALSQQVHDLSLRELLTSNTTGLKQGAENLTALKELSVASLLNAQVQADFGPAPAGNLHKFVDVTKQGVLHIPQGIWNTVQHPVGLLENAAISVGLGTAAKVLLPECGPLRSLAAVGLGLYMTEQTVVPVYNAYKTGFNAKTMAELNAAGNQLGDSLGGLCLNLPIGIVGYKFGAGIGDSIVASPKLSGFVAAKTNFYNRVNDGISSAMNSGKAGLASLFPTDLTATQRAGLGATADSASLVKLRGRIETTDRLTETPKDGEAAISYPKLPSKYESTTENFSGTQVPGISQAFLDNLKVDNDGTYYGAGLRYPDIEGDPQMKAYLEAQNELTMSRISPDVYKLQLANEAHAGGGFNKLPAGWDNGTGKNLNAIDVSGLSNNSRSSITVGDKTYHVTSTGNRSLVSGGKTIIPESKNFEIQQVVGMNTDGANKFAVVGSQEGADILNLYDETGKVLHSVPLPGYGSIHDLRAGDSPTQIQFLYDSPISPPQALTIDFAANQSSLAPLPGYNFDTSKFVQQKAIATYTDIDGNPQEVPFYASYPKDMPLNGLNPALWEIYGGFDVAPQYLKFLPNAASWLMNGGAKVDAVLPGDGGMGMGNYQEGLLKGIRNNVLAADAIAAKLKEMGISSPATAGTPATNAVYGRSNGGMMVNVLLNNSANNFGAAVSESGVDSIFDSPVINPDTGQYWVNEFGDPSDPGQVDWMAKIDPLKNTSASVKYPPTMYEIGSIDGVVNPGNGITLASLRQGMNNGEALLYSRFGEGHDPTTLALQTAFLWDRLKGTANQAR